LTPVPICARSRCCWDTATSKKPRSTCIYRTDISALRPAHSTLLH
jgi:hypothetical protein